MGYEGDATKHPLCRRVFDLIGAGKKGKDVREHFRAAPFGWPQDAIDGALFALVASGNLRATVAGGAVNAQTLPQNQVGVATFYVDDPAPTVQQRLDLKALFQRAGVATEKSKESEAAGQFLNAMLAMAATAGGEAPRPLPPDTQGVRSLQMLSGNAQLLKIHDAVDILTASITSWKKAADTIAKRWPAWERLLELLKFSDGLPEAGFCAASVRAIIEGRTLLAEPDAVPELAQQLTEALRNELSSLRDQIAAVYVAGEARLAASEIWQRLTDEQRAGMVTTCQLVPPSQEAVGTVEQILAALRTRTLADRRNLLDAVPQRFAKALDEAARLLEPKARRVTLPGATITNRDDLDRWLEEARRRVEQELSEGPVIL